MAKTVQAGAEALFRHPLNAASATVRTGCHDGDAIRWVVFSVEAIGPLDPEAFVKNQG
jgi:hypothetical protein